MTKLALPFLLIPLAALAAAAPVPDEAKGPALWFPTRLGAKWTYQYPAGDVTLVVTKVDRKGDALFVSVGQVRDGAVSPHERVEVSAKGLHRLESVAVTTTMHADGRTTSSRQVVVDSPPVCLLKLPARAGDRWTFPHPADRPVTCTAGREEAVRVPAGSYTAVPVDFTIAGPPGMPDIRARYWYAPGVGAVKWTTLDGGEVVLKSFTPGQG